MNTNKNEVRKQVQEHIKEYYSVEDLKKEVENLDYKGSVYNRVAYMVQGGCFLIYYFEVKEFLNSLGINPENKEYTDEKSWELYKHLIAINAERLLNRKGVK